MGGKYCEAFCEQGYDWDGDKCIKADITETEAGFKRIVLLEHAKEYESAKQLMKQIKSGEKKFSDVKVELDDYINYFKICYERGENKEFCKNYSMKIEKFIAEENDKQAEKAQAKLSEEKMKKAQEEIEKARKQSFKQQKSLDLLRKKRTKEDLTEKLLDKGEEKEKSFFRNLFSKQKGGRRKKKTTRKTRKTRRTRRKIKKSIKRKTSKR